jgi:protein dithiol:quinone oxidoreductase
VLNLLNAKLPSRRALNLLGAATCAALMGYALYVQHVLGLEPCPLCVFQRIGMIALGLVLLVAGLHAPGRTGARIYSVLAALCAAGGASVSARHVWLQSLPPDQVPSCGPGLGYLLDTFPLGDALKQVFAGSGECARIDWTFLGQSMPVWVLVAFVGLGAAALFNGWRR